MLADRPASSDPATDALWQAHVARAVRQVRRLRVGVPRPGLARRDRRALRGGLVVALAAALVIAGSDGPARLADAMTPSLPIAPAAPAPQLQVWVTPPSYTGHAPLFLKTEGGHGLGAVRLAPHGQPYRRRGRPPALALNGHAEAVPRARRRELPGRPRPDHAAAG